jgi:hypothetical protein
MYLERPTNILHNTYSDTSTVREMETAECSYQDVEMMVVAGLYQAFHGAIRGGV